MSWLLAGPSTPPARWPLRRRAEYGRLTGAVRGARRAVEDHPVVAAAIARGEWDRMARALRDAAREGEDEEARAAPLVLTA